jgi:hypothetical protein
MRLAGQAEVTAHVDEGYYWVERVRIHVPIVTQPTVRFDCADATINMAAGECWIFDTWREHNVHNDASHHRIHLVADTVGGEAFCRWWRQGRPHDARIAGWAPRLLAPTDARPALVCEHFNIPRVMSPWELQFHVQTLNGELVRGRDTRHPADTAGLGTPVPGLARPVGQVRRFGGGHRRVSGRAAAPSSTNSPNPPRRSACATVHSGSMR